MFTAMFTAREEGFMAMSPFSVFTRKGSDGKNVFWLACRSDVRDGVVSDFNNSDALEYFSDFWKRDSDYVKGRALRGVVLSDKYLQESQSVIQYHHN
jgi:hypothetical protein